VVASRSRASIDAATPPISDADVRALGFEPTRRGWRPLNDEVRARLDAAEWRRTRAPLSPMRPRDVIGDEGERAPCCVCGGDAEPSAVGTPSCSFWCTAQLAETVLPAIADIILAGQLPPPLPRPQAGPPRPSPRSPVPSGRGVEFARVRERLGSCSAVLERHGTQVRGHRARCPFHEDGSPSLSLYEREGVSRWRCHACDMGGDAIDLEARLSGSDAAEVARRW